MKNQFLSLLFIISTSSIVSASALIGIPSDFHALLYKSVNPLTVKYCALDEINEVNRVSGGPFGHAVVWLEDVCLDSTASFPSIRRCTDNDPVKGVGISVNKIFDNVNWVATPGASLFFYGNLKPTDLINKNTKENLIKTAKELGFFKGIILQKKVLDKKPADRDLMDYIIDTSLGTDFAVNWGRDLNCVNIPVTSNMLDRAVEYANLMNSRYADAKKFNSLETKLDTIARQDFEYKKRAAVEKYSWNGLTDNCSHFAYNLIASMGLVPKKAVTTRYLSPSTPAGRLVSLLEPGNTDLPYTGESIYALYTNRLFRESLESENWLYDREGVLLEKIPMHTANNTLFEHTVTLNSLNPFDQLRLKLLKSHAQIFDVKKNLQWFYSQYQRASTAIRNGVTIDPHSQIAVFLESSENKKNFEVFVNEYLDYLLQRQDAVRQELEKLDHTF